jgi:predicted nucleic acid-binding protein
VILVDTSVLVPFFRGTDTPAVRYLVHAVQEEVPIYVTSVVVQEILQGARDEKEWSTLDRHLARQTLVHPTDTLITHRRAARIYFDCRRRGLTVRSTIDCLVAQLALEHDLSLLQDDQDYQAIRAVRPLKLLP